LTVSFFLTTKFFLEGKWTSEYLWKISEESAFGFLS